MVFLPNFKKRIGAKFHKIFLERFEYIRKEIPNQIVEENEKNIIPNPFDEIFDTVSSQIKNGKYRS